MRPGMVPVRVEIRNDGAHATNARLQIACYGELKGTPETRPLATAEYDLALPARNHVMREVNLPVPAGTKRLTALLRPRGKSSGVERWVPVSATFLEAETRTMVVVGPMPPGLCGNDGIVKLSLGGPRDDTRTGDWLRAGQVDRWSGLPQSEVGYGGIDTLLVTTPPAEDFTSQQIEACERWLLRGGRLFIGSPEAAASAEFLARWLPVTLTGTTGEVPVRRLSDLIPYPPTLPSRIAIPVAALRPGARLLLGERKSALIASQRVGPCGLVVWTAFDVTRDPLHSHPECTELWKLLLRTQTPESLPWQGLALEDLRQRIREVSRVRLPGRGVTLMPFVALALMWLVVTAQVAGKIARKEWTWIALIAGTALVAGGYTVAAQRWTSTESTGAGVTTRYLLPNCNHELQVARAGLYRAGAGEVEFAIGASAVNLSPEHESPTETAQRWHLHERADTHHWRFTEQWPHAGGASRLARRNGSLAVRITRHETSTAYHLVNRMPFTLRQGRLVAWVDRDNLLVAPLPTLTPNQATEVSLAPGSSELWSRSRDWWMTSPTASKPLLMKSSRTGYRWELTRWLTERLVVDLTSTRWDYPATVIALTDSPPFPVSLRGVRQDWRHVVVAPIAGSQTSSASRMNENDDLRYSGTLIAAEVMPEERDDATVLGAGETQFELHVNGAKRDQRLYLSADTTALNGARVTWGLFNWRNGQWTRQENQSASETISMDHVHPTLDLVRLRFQVSVSEGTNPQFAIRSLHVQTMDR